MVLGDDVEGHLHVSDKHVPVFDIDPEFVLQGLVHPNAAVDVHVPTLVAPVSVERNGDALRCKANTFQRSGSALFRATWMHLMMRLARRPGWLRGAVRGDGFRCVWGRAGSRTWGQWSERVECQLQLV